MLGCLLMFLMRESVESPKNEPVTQFFPATLLRHASTLTMESRRCIIHLLLAKPYIISWLASTSASLIFCRMQRPPAMSAIFLFHFFIARHAAIHTPSAMQSAALARANASAPPRHKRGETAKRCDAAHFAGDAFDFQARCTISTPAYAASSTTRQLGFRRALFTACSIDATANISRALLAILRLAFTSFASPARRWRRRRERALPPGDGVSLLVLSFSLLHSIDDAARLIFHIAGHFSRLAHAYSLLRCLMI